jgi:hypothetical protein
VFALLVAGCTQEPTAPERAPAEAAVPSPTAVPVLTLMTDVVTPAANTLWGVGNPGTDVEWRELADAAELTMRAFREIRNGGAGPTDMEWAADPRWQAYSDAAIAAAGAARLAIERRDLDALLEANGKLVAPCEACHIDFHIGASPEES